MTNAPISPGHAPYPKTYGQKKPQKMRWKVKTAEFLESA